MGRGKRWDADLRRAIVSMCARGMHHDEVAWHTGVSARTVSRVIAQRKKHGEAAEEARRAMPPEDDARRMDFWVKIARLKAQGRTHAEVEAQLPPDDARALRVVDMCVAFGSSVTAPAEHGRFVARAGPESLFAAFSALFPDLCVLEAAEKKACKGMQKVSISFFNRALEYSGGFERQRCKRWRPGEAGREAGTWMFGCRRWIDVACWHDIEHFRRWQRAFLARLPADVRVPAEYHTVHVVRRISLSWLSKSPDTPCLPLPPPADRKIDKVLRSPRAVTCGSTTSMPREEERRPGGAAFRGTSTMPASSETGWAAECPSAWAAPTVRAAELPPAAAMGTPTSVAVYPRHAPSLPRPPDHMHEMAAQVMSEAAVQLDLAPPAAAPSGHEGEQERAGGDGANTDVPLTDTDMPVPPKSTTRGRRFTPQLRRTVVNMCQRGCSHGEVAKCCNVSLRTVSRILGELKEYGEDIAYEKRKRRGKTASEHAPCAPAARGQPAGMDLPPAHRPFDSEDHGLGGPGMRTVPSVEDMGQVLRSHETFEERELFVSLHWPAASAPADYAASPAFFHPADFGEHSMALREDGERESRVPSPVPQAHTEAFATTVAWAPVNAGALGALGVYSMPHPHMLPI